MLKNITGVPFIVANKINCKKDANVGKYVHDTVEWLILNDTISTKQISDPQFYEPCAS
jgi:hypothetical protein